jgi:hypothetical protein
MCAIQATRSSAEKERISIKSCFEGWEMRRKARRKRLSQYKNRASTIGTYATNARLLLPSRRSRPLSRSPHAPTMNPFGGGQKSIVTCRTNGTDTSEIQDKGTPPVWHVDRLQCISSGRASAPSRRGHTSRS